jgi:hypothetical protein
MDPFEHTGAVPPSDLDKISPPPRFAFLRCFSTQEEIKGGNMEEVTVVCKEDH